MSDSTTADVLLGKKRRGPQPRRAIPLPGGDTLVPRTVFAEEIGVSDRSCARLNLPTRYIGNVAYVRRNESLRIIDEGVRRPNEPPKRRRRR
jgi:hypothetical protein